ncbi:MAG: hypothetical protein IPQ01_08635 [Zoogloea sp.]|nr:hypothetical protein [Zoogloea sp.]
MVFTTVPAHGALFARDGGVAVTAGQEILKASDIEAGKLLLPLRPGGCRRPDQLWTSGA